MNGLRGVDHGLSDRVGPQSGLVVTEVSAAIGVGSDGNPNNHAIFVEDCDQVRVTARNAGPNDVPVCVVQANDFTSDDGDARWYQIDAFPALVAGAVASHVIIQLEGHKWLRVVANCNAGETGSLELAWTGA